MWKGVTDVVGIELLEGLGAVAALEDKGAAHGGRDEAVLEVARLPDEDDRREHLDRLEHGVQLLLARVLGAAASKRRLLLRHRGFDVVGAGWGGDRGVVESGGYHGRRRRDGRRWMSGDL
jgi:hypothetical protein